MTERSIADPGLRIATALLPVLAGAFGLAAPGSILVGALAWFAMLLLVFSGWGYLVVRVSRVSDVDFGLRAAWGLAGYLAVAGVLVMIGVASRPAIFALLGVGAAGFAWREWTAPVASWHRARDGWRFLRSNPALGLLVVGIAGLALVHVLGGIAKLDRNPWDDDVAYTPLLKRMLQIGDLVEPFSFRRLSAYGGQTALQALVGARGNLANVNLLDQSLGQVLALLLIAGRAKELGTKTVWLGLVALVVILMPDASINTASYWTGVVMFVALYRTVALQHWGLAGLVAAATCTLRQNYLAVVVLFLVITLGIRLVAAARETTWRDAWKTERSTWFKVAGVAAAALVAWMVAAMISNGTFLFPILPGDWNTAIDLKPTGMTWTNELEFLLTSCIETAPISVVIPVFVVLVLTSDPRKGRPLTAFFAASIVGFLLLVHNFTGSDPSNMWRYHFGVSVTLLAMFAVEAGAEDEAPITLPLFARWLLLASLVLQIAVNKDPLRKYYVGVAQDIREAAAIGAKGDPTARLEQQEYQALQDAIPAGGRVAVLLDDPAYLDFTRNDIVNLDIPGYAGPAGGLPSFDTADAMSAYLRSRGIRYLAFVRSDESRYFFRRGFWLWRIYHDGELFQVMSAYTIDTLDRFTQLAAKGKVLHDRGGLVAVDLGPEEPSSVIRDPRPEPERRAAFIKALADAEGVRDAWSISMQPDVLFADGFSAMLMIDEEETDDPAWYQVKSSTLETKRGTAARWLYRRAHLRVRGDGARRLVIKGKINLVALYTRPRVDVSIDGELLTAVKTDERGAFTIDTTISADQLAGGWHDVYLVFDSVNEPQVEIREMRVGRILSLEWEPVR